MLSKMNRFETARENEQKLWVKTPFPVSHNTWGFFVKDMFPQFAIDETKVINKDYFLENAMSRWPYPHLRFLVREMNIDGTYKSCITDGEYFRWTHADLPDDNRKEQNVHDWGLVYIPNKAQFGYLDLITGTINLRQKSLEESLEKIKEKEKKSIQGLLLRLKSVLQKQPNTFDEFTAIIFDEFRKYSNLRINAKEDSSNEYIRRLPLTSRHPANSIEGQTELDFYIKLDNILSLPSEAYKELMTSKEDFNRISNHIYESYRNII